MRWDDFRTSSNVEDRRGMRDARRRRRPRHRHHRHSRPHRLGSRHRSPHPDRRRRDDDRRRLRASEQQQQGRERSAAGRDGPLRRGDPRQHRGRLEGCPAQAGEPPVPAAEAGAVFRRDPLRLRRRAIGHGAVLLPARPDGLYRPHLLPGDAAQIRHRRRLRLRLCDRARGRASCREPARHPARVQAAPARGRRDRSATSSRCGSN